MRCTIIYDSLAFTATYCRSRRRPGARSPTLAPQLADKALAGVRFICILATVTPAWISVRAAVEAAAAMAAGVCDGGRDWDCCCVQELRAEQRTKLETCLLYADSAANTRCTCWW